MKDRWRRKLFKAGHMESLKENRSPFEKQCPDTPTKSEITAASTAKKRDTKRMLKDQKRVYFETDRINVSTFE